MPELTSVQRIAQHVTALPNRQLKAALLAWLTHEQPDIDDLANTLAEEQAALEAVDAALEKPAFKDRSSLMSEADMIAASLEAHEEYLQTSEGYSQTEMEAWVEELTSS